MGNKKVTLSVDADVYAEFQKYCEENAIMLSKKVEIIMKKITKGEIK
jgi:antitoxin component of RelBE/YafQ-DinJ toxin-antitoxin module